MPLTPEQIVLERYQVVRIIKSGGMGAVYEAIDTKLASTPCAIKEILASALAGPDAEYVLGSFEKEMRSLAKLEHPNIPRVRDYFEIDGRRYIVLDLVKGKPLDDELAEHLRLTGQPMEPAVVALDMVTVLETLTYLHQQKIVHRDIKSANLIRDQRTGKIKVVDFGIARSVETQRVQTQVGTPGFCAPEQMAGRAEARSDIYSVGATLFNLVTGKLPPAFTFDPLDIEMPDQAKLAAIVEKATAMKPADRYADAEEMAQALRRWLRNEVSTKVKPAELPTQPVRHTVHPLATPPTPPNNQNYVYLFLTVIFLGAASLLFPWNAGGPPVRPVSVATPTPVERVTPLVTKVPATAPTTEVEVRTLPPKPSPSPQRKTPRREPRPQLARPETPVQPTLPGAPGYAVRKSKPAQTPVVPDEPPLANLKAALPPSLASFRRRGPSPGGAVYEYADSGRRIEIRVRLFPNRSKESIMHGLAPAIRATLPSDFSPKLLLGEQAYGNGVGQGRGLLARDGVLFDFQITGPARPWDSVEPLVNPFILAWPTGTD